MITIDMILFRNKDIISKMRVELRQLEKYLDQTLGVVLTTSPWQGAARLAPFLRKCYGFREIRLMDRHCLLMIDEAEQEQSAGVIRKHMDQVREKSAAEVIYVRNQLTSYNRKRLVEYKVSFVVPGNQMYLPMLGVDFREHFRRRREIPEGFMPATQVMMIHWLLKGTDAHLTPARMAFELGFSPMTMTRAFDELEAAELVEVARRGRERRLHFAGPKHDIWIKAQPFLRSPVIKRMFVRQPHPNPQHLQAGLAALSHYTMLAPPAQPVFALHQRDWKTSPHWQDKMLIPRQDPDAVEIEIWRYQPDLLAKQGVVDQLSLYLSLKENGNERVQAALDEMIGRFKW